MSAPQSQPQPMTLLQVQYIENGNNVYKVLVPKTIQEFGDESIVPTNEESINPIICQVQNSSKFKKQRSFDPSELPSITSFTDLSTKFKSVKSLVKLPLRIGRNPQSSITNRPNGSSRQTSSVDITTPTQPSTQMSQDVTKVPAPYESTSVMSQNITLSMTSAAGMTSTTVLKPVDMTSMASLQEKRVPCYSPARMKHTPTLSEQNTKPNSEGITTGTRFLYSNVGGQLVFLKATGPTLTLVSPPKQVYNGTVNTQSNNVSISKSHVSPVNRTKGRIWSAPKASSPTKQTVSSTERSVLKHKQYTIMREKGSKFRTILSKDPNSKTDSSSRTPTRTNIQPTEVQVPTLATEEFISSDPITPVNCELSVKIKQEQCEIETEQSTTILEQLLLTADQQMNNSPGIPKTNSRSMPITTMYSVPKSTDSVMYSAPKTSPSVITSTYSVPKSSLSVIKESPNSRFQPRAVYNIENLMTVTVPLPINTDLLSKIPYENMTILSPNNELHIDTSQTAGIQSYSLTSQIPSDAQSGSSVVSPHIYQPQMNELSSAQLCSPHVISESNPPSSQVRVSRIDASAIPNPQTRARTTNVANLEPPHESRLLDRRECVIKSTSFLGLDTNCQTELTESPVISIKEMAAITPVVTSEVTSQEIIENSVTVATEVSSGQPVSGVAAITENTSQVCDENNADSPVCVIGVAWSLASAINSIKEQYTSAVNEKISENGPLLDEEVAEGRDMRDLCSLLTNSTTSVAKIETESKCEETNPETDRPPTVEGKANLKRNGAQKHSKSAQNPVPNVISKNVLLSSSCSKRPNVNLADRSEMPNLLPLRTSNREEIYSKTDSSRIMFGSARKSCNNPKTMPPIEKSDNPVNPRYTNNPKSDWNSYVKMNDTQKKARKSGPGKPNSKKTTILDKDWKEHNLFKPTRKDNRLVKERPRGRELGFDKPAPKPNSIHFADTAPVTGTSTQKEGRGSDRPPDHAHTVDNRQKAISILKNQEATVLPHKAHWYDPRKRLARLAEQRFVPSDGTNMDNRKTTGSNLNDQPTSKSSYTAHWYNSERLPDEMTENRFVPCDREHPVESRKAAESILEHQPTSKGHLHDQRKSQVRKPDQLLVPPGREHPVGNRGAAALTQQTSRLPYDDHMYVSRVNEIDRNTPKPTSPNSSPLNLSKHQGMIRKSFPSGDKNHKVTSSKSGHPLNLAKGDVNTRTFRNTENRTSSMPSNSDTMKRKLKEPNTNPTSTKLFKPSLSSTDGDDLMSMPSTSGTQRTIPPQATKKPGPPATNKNEAKQWVKSFWEKLGMPGDMPYMGDLKTASKNSRSRKPSKNNPFPNWYPGCGRPQTENTDPGINHPEINAGANKMGNTTPQQQQHSSTSGGVNSSSSTSNVSFENSFENNSKGKSHAVVRKEGQESMEPQDLAGFVTSSLNELVMKETTGEPNKTKSSSIDLMKQTIKNLLMLLQKRGGTVPDVELTNKIIDSIQLDLSEEVKTPPVKDINSIPENSVKPSQAERSEHGISHSGNATAKNLKPLQTEFCEIVDKELSESTDAPGVKVNVKRSGQGTARKQVPAKTQAESSKASQKPITKSLEHGSVAQTDNSKVRKIVQKARSDSKSNEGDENKVLISTSRELYSLLQQPVVNPKVVERRKLSLQKSHETANESRGLLQRPARQVGPKNYTEVPDIIISSDSDTEPNMSDNDDRPLSIMAKQNVDSGVSKISSQIKNTTEPKTKSNLAKRKNSTSGTDDSVCVIDWVGDTHPPKVQRKEPSKPNNSHKLVSSKTNPHSVSRGTNKPADKTNSTNKQKDELGLKSNAFTPLVRSKYCIPSESKNKTSGQEKSVNDKTCKNKMSVQEKSVNDKTCTNKMSVQEKSVNDKTCKDKICVQEKSVDDKTCKDKTSVQGKSMNDKSSSNKPQHSRMRIESTDTDATESSSVSYSSEDDSSSFESEVEPVLASKIKRRSPKALTISDSEDSDDFSSGSHSNDYSSDSHSNDYSSDSEITTKPLVRKNQSSMPKNATSKTNLKPQEDADPFLPFIVKPCSVKLVKLNKSTISKYLGKKTLAKQLEKQKRKERNREFMLCLIKNHQEKQKQKELKKQERKRHHEAFYAALRKMMEDKRCKAAEKNKKLKSKSKETGKKKDRASRYVSQTKKLVIVSPASELPSSSHSVTDQATGASDSNRKDSLEEKYADLVKRFEENNKLLNIFKKKMGHFD